MTPKRKKTPSAPYAPRNDELAQHYEHLNMPAVAAAARYQGTKNGKSAKRGVTENITRHGAKTSLGIEETKKRK